MSRPRRSFAVLVLALPILAASAAGPGVDGATPPISLRLGIPDSAGRASEPAVTAFVDAVARDSGGSITIEPLWRVGDDTPEQFEVGTGRLLLDGQVDLALVAGRAWHDLGSPALDVLQTPFLIDTDPLAVAVASAPVADDLLADLHGIGVTGLALWPEDLRHPVAFEGCTAPIVTPAEMRGLTVRTIQSALTADLLEQLGATAVHPDDLGALIERCDIQAAESGLLQWDSLSGRPAITADVAFYPKFQVLAAGGGSWAGLTADQRAILQRAAREARDVVLAGHRPDAELVAAWCAAGGRVVLAGPDGVAAFRAAAQPLVDRLTADPTTGAAVHAIEQLRSAVPAAPSLASCDPAPSPSTSPEAASSIGPASSAAPVASVAGLGVEPPSGTYRTLITRDDLGGVDPSNAGTVTLTVGAGSWQTTWGADSPGGEGSCGGTWTFDGNVTRLATASFADCVGGWTDVVFHVTPDGGLIATVVGADSPRHRDADTVVLGSHPWSRLD